jgi:glycosyltransferase involved in cell wall biosynthesis/SAM-dependent methyltransferase
MQMTWAELAQATPDGFSPVAWPSGRAGPLDDQAVQLVRAAQVLASSPNGPLVGEPIAVVSSHPGHAILARLLACHGAAVTFFCPRPVAWEEGYARLFRTLRSQIEQVHEHLDPAPLCGVTAATFLEGPGFSVAPQWPSAPNHPFAGRFTRVFAYEVLGDAPGQAAQVLAQLAGLLNSCSFIELFGGERGPETRALLERVLAQSSDLGFGAQAASASPDGEWRLSLRWLGGPVREYPREEDQALLLAHCQARLHFAAHFVAGAEVLEAGCGSGVGTKLFLGAGAAHVVALDYNAEALALAHQRAADPRADYRQWNLNQTPLPLPDARFDVVVCLEVLEHVREQRALLDEFCRVLKPGGRLIVSIPERDFEEQHAVLNGHRNTFHVHVPTRPELEQALVGFTDVRFARQIDFLGSCVVEDGAPGSGGEWLEQAPGSGRDTAETIVAVCVKPPASLARPAGEYRPRLCVFDNALRLQLNERKDIERLRISLAEEKVGRWADRNQYAAAMRRASASPLGDPGWQKDLVPAWFRGGHEAYAHHTLLPGEWIPRFEQLLAIGAGAGTPAEVRQPTYWELVEGSNGALLRPGEPSPVAVRTVLYPRPADTAGVRSLWQWLRRGARDAWFAEDGGWKQYDLLTYALWRTLRWVGGRLFPCVRRRTPSGPDPGGRLTRWTMRLGGRSRPAVVSHPPSSGSGASAWLARVAADDARPRPEPAKGASRKVVHYIGALHSGGAERQLCNLAVGQKERGLDVRVLTTCELAGDCAHYAGLLTEGKVPVQQAGRPRVSQGQLAAVPWHLLRPVPANIQRNVIDLIHELLVARPDVLHGWLDQPNVITAIAGLLAGVPQIILSTRNVNPTNFPRLWEEFFPDWYQLASRSSRVHLIANSRRGGASYAEWLGLPPERIHVVYNGVRLDHFPEPTDELRRRARQSFGLPAGAPVVCGVFRLAAEKQPDLFLDVVRRVRARVPGLRVLLAGVGDMEPRVRQVLREHDMGEWVQLLGRRSDVAPVFLASDASLLTSMAEGCPNVALESQYLGVPVVATDVGGTGDAVAHGVTGLLAGVSDAEGLAAALARVLLNADFRGRLSAAGPGLVRSRFGLGQMIENTLAVYDRTARGGASHGGGFPPAAAPATSAGRAA